MSVLTPGARVDRFEIEVLLGRGGLAEVYRVRHDRLGSRYALKVVTVPGRSVARRLIQEGRIQAQLKHPAIVEVTDVVEFDGYVALVLEYIEGASLRALVDAHGRLSLVDTLAIFSHVLAGVGAAHAAQVLHRDLKPDNVMLAPVPGGCVAKVADFGIAKMLATEPGRGETAQGVVMGTPGYMAPEQTDDASTVDARADVFSLGVMLYELLTGVAPFDRENLGRTIGATLSGQYTPLRQLRDDVPDRVVDVVIRSLQVDPDARFPSVAALASVLYADDPDALAVATGRFPPRPIDMVLPADLRLRAAGVSVGMSGPDASATAVPSEVLDGEPPARPRTVAGPTPASETLQVEPVVSRRWSVLPGVVAFLVVGVVGATVFFVLPRPASSPLLDAPGGEVAVEAPAVPVSAPPGDGPATTPNPAPGSPATPADAPGVVTAVAGTEGRTAPVDQAPAAPAQPAGQAMSGAPPMAGATGESAGAAPAVVPEMPAGEAGPEGAASAPAAPEPTPMPAAGAASPAAETVTRVEDAAATAAPTVDASGTWKGTWSGRPMTLKIKGATAELEVLVGTSYRTWQLRGGVQPDGRFEYAGGEGAEAWWVSGTVKDGQLSGSARSGSGGKATGFSARRR